ncbi:class I SAM-dependent methyltransferase [Kribbella sp. CA-247076]|uniref:class I SAM-dependent methyltransferase n=1 Tax=Kribbella sp. CA-247076 TaxID=3239941 RepID=UPI003D931523
MSARYDGVADYYATGWTDDLDDPVTAALFDVLGGVDGQRVLDVACGHGRISRGLARRGASVVGVDLSPAMLGKACELEDREPLGIRYLHADAADPDLLRGETYDAAVCSMGLSDIDDLDGTVANVHRLLRPGGTFAFCILHPCFPGVEGVSGAWPSDSTYYDERYWQADGALSTLRQQVGANHRTLSTYLNTLHHHGLTLTRTAEPRPVIDPSSPKAPAARYPFFLVISCRAN